VNAAKPDIFVSTGDLVDAQINHLTGLAELLRSVKARYGSYAVTGNHEYYAGLDRALQFTQEAGFTLLRGRGMDIGPIIIAGVDDETGAQMGIEKAAVHPAAEAPAAPRSGIIRVLRPPAVGSYAPGPDIPLPLCEQDRLSLERRMV
jgi:hypothetical protein